MATLRTVDDSGSGTRESAKHKITSNDVPVERGKLDLRREPVAEEKD